MKRRNFLRNGKSAPFRGHDGAKKTHLFGDVFGLDHGHGGPVDPHADLEQEEAPHVYVPARGDVLSVYEYTW